MNWLYMIVMGYIIISALSGFHKGFIRVLYSIAAIFIAAAFVAFSMPVFRDMLLKHTALETQIEKAGEKYVRDRADRMLEEGMQAADKKQEKKEQEKKEQENKNQEKKIRIKKIRWLSLPKALENELVHGSKESILDLMEEQGVYQKAAKAIADFCISCIAFFLALAIISILLFLAGRKLDLFSKTPGIHLANMILGFLAGIAKAFVVIWIVFSLIQATAVLPSSAALIDLIEENAVLHGLYEKNRILELVQRIM